MKSFSIGNRLVGKGAPVFLVAELSANHGGKKEIALRTIEAAARAGADAIKLQTYTPDTLTLRSSAPPFIVNTSNVWSGRTLYDLYQEAMTPWEWHADLMDAARANGLLCFSTPFDPTAIAFLESARVPAHKVASFELNDLPLVEAMARTGKPMIMSTGMASLADVEAAVRVCREAGNDQIALLRCVSSYPAHPETMDLASYDVLRGFDCVLGLSDHTRDATVAITAVALGVKVIEKHFILRRDVGGPDSFFSLEPDEFAAMTKAVRDAEAAIGQPRFGPAADERASTAFRRSLFMARDVKAGQLLTCDVVRSVRPANGLHPRHLPTILGRRAARDLSEASPLDWDGVGSHPEIRLELCRATHADSELLRSWRNDTTTREMSTEQGETTPDAHEAWLAKSLDSPERLVFIAQAEGVPVGTVRLDTRSCGESEISLTVAPVHRGRGFGQEMLRAVEPIAARKDVIRLVAKIRVQNDRSIRAFKNAGYYGFYQSTEFLHCERRIAPYAH